MLIAVPPAASARMMSPLQRSPWSTSLPSNKDHPMQPVPLYQWVSEHNPAPELSYGKGWWDTIECIYRLQDTYREALTVTVVRTFTMHTPPPPEQLLMPTFRLHHEEVDALLRCDFSHPINPPWVVSIQRRQKARVPLYGL